MDVGFVGGEEPGAEPSSVGAGGQDRGDATGGADSTGRDNRHRHEVEHHVEEGSKALMPRTCPPASTPWAMTKSHPACSAATASVGKPICQAVSAPPRCTRPMSPSKVSVRGSPTDSERRVHRTSRCLKVRGLAGVFLEVPLRPARRIPWLRRAVSQARSPRPPGPGRRRRRIRLGRCRAGRVRAAGRRILGREDPLRGGGGHSVAAGLVAGASGRVSRARRAGGGGGAADGGDELQRYGRRAQADRRGVSRASAG